VVAAVIVTLSNVAVQSAFWLWLVTARPTTTLDPIVTLKVA